MSGITLSAAARQSLISLQNVADLQAKTQNRLNTGKKVNSVLDDAVAFFNAQSLNNRATDLNSRKDAMQQGLNGLNATLKGVSSITDYIKQIKAQIESAKTKSVSERTAITSNIKELGKQVASMIKDTSYQGLNLLTSTAAKLSVQFSERTAAVLNVKGFDFDATAGNERGIFTNAGAFDANGSFLFSNAVFSDGGVSYINGSANSMAGSNFADVITKLDKAITKLQNHASTLGIQVSILQTRLDFTKNYVNELTAGADNLTLADLQEESANMVALNTRQSLGIQALSLANQNQQAILQLLR